MHGCGNDYIYVDAAKEMIEHPSDLAIRLSDRHFGIGSDGLILICPSGQADFRMRMYNADGSEAEMCGNGIRCVAKYVYDKGLTDKTSITDRHRRYGDADSTSGADSGLPRSRHKPADSGSRS